MATGDSNSISSRDVYHAQINELKERRIDCDKLKNELNTALTKYDRHLSQFTNKIEQLHLQAEKIREEQDEKETNLLNATKEWLDIKTKLETSAMSIKQKVKLNVGGEYFETTIDTLTKDIEGTTSYFNALFSRQWQLEKDPKEETIFIDRDGCLFGYILQYFRTGQLIIDFDNSLFRKSLMAEAEFYKLDHLIELLKMNDTITENSASAQKNLYSNTKLLSCEQQKQLNKLYGKNNQNWQLIYRASHDGFTSKVFHQLCDDRGATMTVIRSQTGFIFGGYTTIAWSSLWNDKTDSSAFLFTLKNPHDIVPTKYPIHQRSVRFAVSHRMTNGPTFGSVSNGGSDIYLQSPFNTYGSRVFFPRTYKDTTDKGQCTFTGHSHFTCNDIEVFVII